MNHWPFIMAAYVITVAGTVGVTLASFLRMRRGERRAEALTRRD